MTILMFVFKLSKIYNFDFPHRKKKKLKILLLLFRGYFFFLKPTVLNRTNVLLTI